MKVQRIINQAIDNVFFYKYGEYSKEIDFYLENNNLQYSQLEYPEKSYINKNICVLIADYIDHIAKKNGKTPPNIFQATESWSSSRYGFRYHYLHKYLPTSRDVEATPEQWETRRMIWKFKDDGKYSPLYDKMLEGLTRFIKNTFGTASSELTLLCVPASTKAKNNIRYSNLSKELTLACKMINSFPYITITEDREAIHANNVSRNISANYILDSDFFKGKNVLLFDDVITTGSSINKAKQIVERCGGRVVGAITIGKTVSNNVNTIQDVNIEDCSKSEYDDSDYDDSEYDDYSYYDEGYTDSELRRMYMDAFEGDPEAQWNID